MLALHSYPDCAGPSELGVGVCVGGNLAGSTQLPRTHAESCGQPELPHPLGQLSHRGNSAELAGTHVEA